MQASRCGDDDLRQTARRVASFDAAFSLLRLCCARAAAREFAAEMQRGSMGALSSVDLGLMV